MAQDTIPTSPAAPGLTELPIKVITREHRRLADWLKKDLARRKSREAVLLSAINRMASALESVAANMEGSAKAVRSGDKVPFGGSYGAILSMVVEEAEIGRLVVGEVKTINYAAKSKKKSAAGGGK